MNTLEASDSSIHTLWLLQKCTQQLNPNSLKLEIARCSKNKQVVIHYTMKYHSAMKEEPPNKNKQQELPQLEKGHLQTKQYKLRTHQSESATQLRVLLWSFTENVMSICEE